MDSVETPVSSKEEIMSYTVLDTPVINQVTAFGKHFGMHNFVASYF
jgi:hypothetical protein